MIEVLKQMVEALEWCHGGEPVGTAEAIQAGKKLIAELESQYPHGMYGAEDLDKAWKSGYDNCKDQFAYLDEQEPVALETVYETIIQWDEGGGKRSRRELARRIVSLYTSPPQRQQEPVAWFRYESFYEYRNQLARCTKDCIGAFPVYTSPPQRQWVGLIPLNIEDDYVRNYLWERALIAVDDPCARSHPHEDMNEYCQHKTELARYQAKLKEKNT